MITLPLQWTPSAREGLERYFAARLVPDLLEGADALEVRADLESHLEMELQRRGGTDVTVVTVEDLRQVLARMGETLPEAPVRKPLAPRPVVKPPETVEAPAGKPKTYRWFRFAALWFPLFVFAFEVITRGCAGMLFNAMPDPFHHLLVLLVPLAAWLFLKSRRGLSPTRLALVAPWAMGAATAVVIYYSLCLLPVAPMAVPATLWFGVGLLALSPFFALAAVRPAWKRLAADGPLARRRLRQGFWGMTALIVLMALPVIITRVGLHRAVAAGSGENERAAATRLVRKWGSDEALLRACYARPFRFQMNRSLNDGPVAWLADWIRRPGEGDSADADRLVSTSRDLYFRVTGQSFSAVPRPAQARPWIFTPFNPQRFFRQDEDRGGTQVAGRIDGLSLAEGRIDWHCGQASGLTWGEWTLTFENTTSQAEEARCRIALPPGGFVSRVTLWVNGKPEEAAYSALSTVRAAYQSVAVQQQRDPVLVTQPDAGSILVQAFPVPAHGQLKTRLTFTVPAGADARVWLPSMVEQNFELSPAARHALWIQADGGTLTLPETLRPELALEDGHPTLTASLAPEAFTGPGTFFTWNHQPDAVVYSENPFAGPESKMVVRQHAPPVPFQPGSVAWVIDTSAGLDPHKEAIQASLRNFASGVPSAVFLPGDAASELQTLTDPAAVTLSFAGGRDNTPALAAAIAWLRGKPQPCLIWIHGPQPGAAAPPPLMDQLLERSVARFTLMDVPLVPGENVLSPLFANRPRITTVPVRHGGLDLTASLVAALQQPGGTFTAMAADAILPEGAVKTSDSLARWYARTETGRLALSDPASASAFAAAHQIVSPWSGAVVLERTSDYAQHGLQQSDAAVSQQIPLIPEPSGVLLLLLSAGHFLLRRRR